MSRQLALDVLLALVELRARLACAAVGVGAVVVPPEQLAPVLACLEPDDEPTVRACIH